MGIILVLFSSPQPRYKIPSGTPSAGELIKGWEILQISPFIWETVRDRAIVYYGTVIGSHR